MTKEEAIFWLDAIRMAYICDPNECGCELGGDLCKVHHCDEHHEALVMAIKSLKGEEGSND